MVKPGGTGRPRLVISARFAPLPPKRSLRSLLPSVNSYTYFGTSAGIRTLFSLRSRLNPATVPRRHRSAVHYGPGWLFTQVKPDEVVYSNTDIIGDTTLRVPNVFTDHEPARISCGWNTRGPPRDDV